jgi:YbbR domain-containing protein
MKHGFSGILSENFSFKIVALFITLILWLTILGRRDFVLSKDIEISLMTGADAQIVAQTADHVKVKVSGSRALLKKFLESSVSQEIAIDISQRGQGIINVDIPIHKIDVPPGVRILGIRPNQIQAEVVTKKAPDYDK